MPEDGSGTSLQPMSCTSISGSIKFHHNRAVYAAKLSSMRNSTGLRISLVERETKRIKSSDVLVPIEVQDQA